MKPHLAFPIGLLASLLLAPSVLLAAADPEPASRHQQLPTAMHGPMASRPRVTVGLRQADITGADQRALQAAVDYVASLGGGLVEIGPGEFLMHVLENNLIENKGLQRAAAGIRVRGETRDLVFTNNTIRDTRSGPERKQVVGIQLEEKVGQVKTDGNHIDAATPIQDGRKSPH